MLNPILLPSPNFDERDPSVPLQFIVLHYTGMPTGGAALQRLTDPVAKVSAHYVIEEDGRLFQLVNESKRAWHAGKSFWRGVKDINSSSIGIELVNPGHEFGYRAFLKPQLDMLKLLLNEICLRHSLDSKKCLLGHSDIAPTRKEDPGELFPWQELARDGVGVWPASVVETKMMSQDQIVQCLNRIGFDCSYMDATIRAFQRRFVPHDVTGIVDAETSARLESVAKLLG